MPHRGGLQMLSEKVDEGQCPRRVSSLAAEDGADR